MNVVQTQLTVRKREQLLKFAESLNVQSHKNDDNLVIAELGF
jgi:hypothetical protein